MRNKALNIAKNPKYDGYQRGLASVVNKVFAEKTSGSGIKNENISNHYFLDLAEESGKAIIIKFKKRKVHSPFMMTIFWVLILPICS